MKTVVRVTDRILIVIIIILYCCVVPCFAGSYNEIHGSESCLPCPEGSYQEEPASTQCVRCPSGKTTNITGASSVAQCGVDDVTVKQGQTDQSAPSFSLHSFLLYPVYTIEQTSSKCIQNTRAICSTSARRPLDVC